MTVRFLMLTTMATSPITNNDCLAPLAAALSAIEFICCKSLGVSRMLRDCKRCIACAENLSGCPGAASVACRRASRNPGPDGGGICTGVPTGRDGVVAAGAFGPFGPLTRGSLRLLDPRDRGRRKRLGIPV